MQLSPHQTITAPLRQLDQTLARHAPRWMQRTAATHLLAEHPASLAATGPLAIAVTATISGDHSTALAAAAIVAGLWLAGAVAVLRSRRTGREG